MSFHGSENPYSPRRATIGEPPTRGAPPFRPMVLVACSGIGAMSAFFSGVSLIWNPGFPGLSYMFILCVFFMTVFGGVFGAWLASENMKQPSPIDSATENRGDR